ncbi:S8 family serine peptidase [Paenibacillus sedimenti]|uniref:S8 family serine peptidase n=1 Tax=Paenibacillus sedimenti TaxID=2770274 RepID=A0A926KNX0_9BACL|nr:S8 family serine peptidase [Paenibacillus sedimenti]MBD0379574.1 S8 family serine peptidase [Paenibacillus sedimenti]
MKVKLSVALFSSVIAASTLLSGVGLSKPASGVSTAKKYLIAYQNNIPADYEASISGAGGKVLRVLPELGSLEVESSDTAFLTKIKQVSGIRGANLELVHQLDYKKVDPAAADGQPVTDIPQHAASFWEYQWDVKRVTNDGATYGLETGGKLEGGSIKHKAIVGVIDSGIDANHPDLKANVVGGKNFVPAGIDASETGDPADIRDRDGHGTHVAGSIAANGKVKGIGPDLGIRSYRVFPEGQGAPTSWIAAAIVQAANDKVDVINMSLGGFDAISRYTFEGGSYSDVADTLVWKRAVDYALSKNVTVVVAAGNDSLNLNNPTEITDYMNAQYGSLGFSFKGASRVVPGQTPGVITVSSSNQWSTEKIAFYSNYGTKSIDVSAPGGDNGPVYAETGDLNQRDFHYRTLSTWPTYLPSYFTSNLTSYALLHGTSMASPKVAGMAGVIKAAHPELTPSQVTALISQSAIDWGKKGTDQLYGAGEANLYNALTQK